MEIFPFPPVLRLEPAATCNFRCRHCPTGLDLSPAGIMSEQTFATILAKLQPYRFRVIVMFHGGEPLLNKRFYGMVKQLRPLARIIKVNTNGSLLAKNIDALIDCGLDKLMVSLDGRSAEENDQIRTGANFYQITAAIRQLLARQAERGISRPQVYLHNIQIARSDPPGQISVPQCLLDELGEYIRRGQIEWDALSWAYLWPGLPVPPQAERPERNYCDSIVNTITIRWNGDVVPCCNDLTSQMVIGNALREELANIWNNARYRKLRADIQTFQPPALCQNCPELFPARIMEQKQLDLIQIANAH